MICKGMAAQHRTLRQCARGVGAVALVFSLTVAALLAADGYRSGLAETVRSEVLSQALAQGRSTPQDAQAVAFARGLDQLARRAYFNSLTFRQGGMALLVIGLLVTAGCFGLVIQAASRSSGGLRAAPAKRSGWEEHASRNTTCRVTKGILAALAFHVHHTGRGYRRHGHTHGKRFVEAVARREAGQPGDRVRARAAVLVHDGGEPRKTALAAARAGLFVAPVGMRGCATGI